MEKVKTKNKFWPACFASLGIILAGGVAWGAMYSLGFFSSWVAVIFSYLATFVYLKIKKDGKWGMFALIFVSSIIVNYLSMVGAITVIGLFELPEYSFIEIFVLALQLSFGIGIVDTLTCVAFTALGVGVGRLGDENRRNKLRAKQEAQAAQAQNIPQAETVQVAPAGVEIDEHEKVDVDQLYERILSEISQAISLKKAEEISDSELTKRVSEIIKAGTKNLDEKEMLVLQNLCLITHEDEGKDMARKVLIKVISKE